MAEPRGPLMSPGFWLHHAALAGKQVFDRRLRPLKATPTQFMLLASVSWLTATTGRSPTRQEAADHAGAQRPSSEARISSACSSRSRSASNEAKKGRSLFVP